MREMAMYQAASSELIRISPSGTKVRTIPATVQRFAPSVPLRTRPRVAAYARVSTDEEEQLSSYEAQVDYYTHYIQSNPEWSFVEVYADEGITGCNTRKRDGFNRMVGDALAGKIDLIVTKSVSRFARNTVDSLTTIRTLKEHGVEVYFEKENIWTFDGKGELMISTMSSLAQEESRSISENCVWGQRKRFADGKVTVPFGRFLGYDRGPDGNLAVNEAQAKVVRRIYALFLEGNTPYAISKILTADGVPTPGGKKNWSKTVVLSILKNEKYKGDALLQKVYTEDFLTKRKVRNSGQVPQYYVEGNHEAIVSPEVFDLVQEEIARRRNGSSRYSGVQPFSGMVYCGDCGGLYGPKVWHSNDQYRRTVWQCTRKYRDTICRTPHLTEAQLREKVVSAMQRLSDDRAAVLRAAESIRDSVYDTSALQDELEQVQRELTAQAEKLNRAIRTNASVAQDQAEHQQRMKKLTARYQALQERYQALTEEFQGKDSRRAGLNSFLRQLKKLPETITAPDAITLHVLIERITVNADRSVVIRFRDGTEVSERL